MPAVSREGVREERREKLESIFQLFFYSLGRRRRGRISLRGVTVATRYCLFLFLYYESIVSQSSLRGCE